MASIKNASERIDSAGGETGSKVDKFSGAGACAMSKAVNIVATLRPVPGCDARWMRLTICKEPVSGNWRVCVAEGVRLRTVNEPKSHDFGYIRGRPIIQ